MRSYRTVATALFVALLAFAPMAWAGSSALPPDVDLDPDRGMTFGRLGKTHLPTDVFKPMKESTRSRSMDPAIDPFNSPLGGDRYDPSTGRIQGSLSDTLREMRRQQEDSRTSGKDADKTKAEVSISKKSASQKFVSKKYVSRKAVSGKSD